MRRLKKIKQSVLETRKKCQPNSRVRLMFQDEAGFGRINKPKRCWCGMKIRLSVSCHHIREYRYAYGAVEPMTGENFFLIMPYCSTNCMNTFLEELAKQYPQDQILLVCDSAARYKSKTLKVPANISLLGIPPYTPKMNPIEQIWKQLRSMGFRNEVFKTLEHVVDRLRDTICNLTNEMVRRISCRQRIADVF